MSASQISDHLDLLTPGDPLSPIYRYMPQGDSTPGLAGYKVPVPLVWTKAACMDQLTASYAFLPSQIFWVEKSLTRSSCETLEACCLESVNGEVCGFFAGPVVPSGGLFKSKYPNRSDRQNHVCFRT